jgi:hypothetical protein
MGKLYLLGLFWVISTLAWPQTRGQQIQVTVPVVVEPFNTVHPAHASQHRGNESEVSEIEANQERANELQAQIAGSGRLQGKSQSATPLAQLSVVGRGPFDTAYPPDAQIAVGPNNEVAVINDLIGIYDRNAQNITPNTFIQLSAFFNTNGDIFDPQVLFDVADGRYFLTMAEKTGSGGIIHIAVSATSEPTGTWYKFSYDVTGPYSGGGNQPMWPDRPQIGISAHALYIWNTEVPYTPNISSDLWLSMIQLPELLAGNPNLKITRFVNQNDPSGQRVWYAKPVTNYDGTSPQYLIASDSLTFQTNRLFLLSVDETANPPTLSVSTITVPPYQSPPAATQPNGAQVDSGTDLISTATLSNGSLWTAHTIADASGANPVVRWYELDPAASSVKQSGTLTGAGEAFFPAITALPDGTAAMVFSTASSSTAISAAYALRHVTDPAGTMPTSGIYALGNGAWNGNRWGDYSGISRDPGGTSIWGIAELVDAAAGSLQQHSTEIGELTIAAVSSSSVSLSVSPNPTAGAPITLTATLTGTGTSSGTVSFFDGGSSLGTATPSNGSASLTLNTLAAGTHTFTAQSSGETSAALQVTVAQDFAISAANPSLTFAVGQSGSDTVTIAPAPGGFTSPVALSCSGLPANYSCVFAQSSVTPGTSAHNTTLTIQPASTTGHLRENLGIGFALAFAVLLPGIALMRQHPASFLFCFLAMLACVMIACGGSAKPSASPNPNPAAGTGSYNLVVTGTSGTDAHSTTIHVTIQ